jgi:hypothetical protein
MNPAMGLQGEQKRGGSRGGFRNLGPILAKHRDSANSGGVATTTIANIRGLHSPKRSTLNFSR